MAKKQAKIKELADVARQSEHLDTEAVIDLPKEEVLLHLTAYEKANFIQTQVGGGSQLDFGYSRSFAAGLADLVKNFKKGKLRFEAVKVKCSKGPLKPKELKELKQLAVAAWAEAMGVEPPSADELKQTVKRKKQSQSELRDELLGLLRSGPKGIKQWNGRVVENAIAGDFRRIDLSGAKLAGAAFTLLDLREANFNGASLAGAVFTEQFGSRYGEGCNLKKANFKNADLKKADFRAANCTAANFEGANLAGAQLRTTYLAGANLKNADLRKAALHYACLRGADLTGANLDGADLEGAQYDETTTLPAGFQPPENMQWEGKKKIAPPLRKVLAAPAAALDFAAFVERLEQTTDAAKLAKALAMLKADRFRLFADVKDDAVSGVVKSQTDAELVYSCRLAADGRYACCTQNLNVCGGLRGSLCKHLLVLIVGLTKAGELDATRIDEWVQASRANKPELDKDQMSETFLRYKGAEAGEVDWRPTETIPEDYYAL